MEVVRMKQLMQLAMAVLLLVIISVVIGVGVMVTSSISATLTGSSQAAVDNGTAAISSFAGWLPTVAIIIVAVVVISLLIYGFSSFFGKNSA
jgi:uncharacterized protein involved in cysteine biosynthesis